MGVAPTEELPFVEDDLAPVVALLEDLQAAEAGWINFSPEVEPGAEPLPRNLLAKAFSARGDAVPLATWLAPTGTEGRSSLGIEHGSGPRALDHLSRHDLALPEGWQKVADHPRRGLVVSAPASASADDVLWWLLTAAHLLSSAPLTGAWLARVYRP